MTSSLEAERGERRQDRVLAGAQHIDRKLSQDTRWPRTSNAQLVHAILKVLKGEKHPTNLLQLSNDPALTTNDVGHSAMLNRHILE